MFPKVGKLSVIDSFILVLLVLDAYIDQP